MDTVTLAVVHAGLSASSTTKLLADRLSAATVKALGEQGVDTAVTVIDLRRHAHALADALLSGFPGGELAGAIERLSGADAVVAVTPTFSASYSGLFKLFLDVLEPGTLRGKPVVLGASGGTERHSLMLDHALRPLFTYLGADPVPTGVFLATGDLGATSGQAISERIVRAGRELAARIASSATATIPGAMTPSATTPSATTPAAGTTPAPASTAAGAERRATPGWTSSSAGRFGDDLMPFDQLLARASGR